MNAIDFLGFLILMLALFFFWVKKVLPEPPIAEEIEEEEEESLPPPPPKTAYEPWVPAVHKSYVAPIQTVHKSYIAPIPTDYRMYEPPKRKQDAYSIPVSGSSSFAKVRLNQETLRAAIVLKIILDKPKSLDDS